jgi:hypothetical protein
MGRGGGDFGHRNASLSCSPLFLRRRTSIADFYRAEFTGGARLKGPQPKVVVNRVLVIRAAAATLVMIALFFFGVVPSKVAIIIPRPLAADAAGNEPTILRGPRLVAVANVRGSLFIIVEGAQHALLTLDVSPLSAVFISVRLLSERRHRRSGQQRIGDADIEAVCRGAARLWQGGGSRSRWRRRSPATSTVPGSIVNLIVEETGV